MLLGAGINTVPELPELTVKAAPASSVGTDLMVTGYLSTHPPEKYAE